MSSALVMWSVHSGVLISGLRIRLMQARKEDVAVDPKVVGKIVVADPLHLRVIRNYLNQINQLYFGNIGLSVVLS
jgi:hypothetical protein